VKKNQCKQSGKIQPPNDDNDDYYNHDLDEENLHYLTQKVSPAMLEHYAYSKVGIETIKKEEGGSWF
jgi:hypothetical protein